MPGFGPRRHLAGRGPRPPAGRVAATARTGRRTTLTGTRRTLAARGSPRAAGPDGRCGGAPAPTPNGLLPTRGARGPGLGDCRRGGTTAPPAGHLPAPPPWGCCCWARRRRLRGRRLAAPRSRPWPRPAAGPAARPARRPAPARVRSAGAGPGRTAGFGAGFGAAARLCGRGRGRLLRRCAGAGSAGAAGFGLRAGGRLRPRATLGAALGAVRLGVRVPQPAGHRGLHRGGRGLHELALLLELRENFLAGNAELLRELVHSGLACHCSPRPSEAGGMDPLDLVLSSGVHGFSFTADS